MALEVVLFQPEIPQNTGAIGRLCVGLELRLHLVRPLGFRLTDRFVRRAGLDYWEHLELLVHEDWESMLAVVGVGSIRLASTHAERSIYDSEFDEDTALVFGSESAGLPEDLRCEYAERSFRIPMPGTHARSLNLAQAAAVAVYELHRRGLCG